jgi:hypothetical protein
MAKWQTSCGQDSCLCSLLFLDLDLTKAWLNTAKDYLQLAKHPRKDVVLRQLLQPWKLTNLKEHETCFQQWNIMQLWIGIVATLVVFSMNIIWFIAEENEYAKPSIGAIIINTIVGLVSTVFFTHLAWYGVINKHGCCCFILCCCVGKPNLLVVAIVSLLFGVLAIIAAFQALGSVQGALIVAVLVGALFALMHGIALLYVSFEAVMIWKFSASSGTENASRSEEGTKADHGEVVGVPQTTGDPMANMEAGETKTEA